ncbi:MAG: M2 family metallopeptidase [Oscillospiraceae bacterium]|nr:M2 family metallopeptidase [Oscillospiraceae bacterium]
MKSIRFRVIALILSMALLLGGCGVLDFSGYFDKLADMFGPVSFDNMEYTRPDLSGLDGALEACLESAADGKDLDRLVGDITTLNSICSAFQTNYLLAFIHYSIDMSDTYWETEYNYCAQQGTKVQAAVDELMYALAECSLRGQLEAEEYFGEGYFDDYDGESLWTEAFTALMEQETELVNSYYELSAQALLMDPTSEEFFTTCGAQLQALYVQMVKLRQQIAAEAGYGSYPEFAYEFYFDRDYTPEQAATYLADIRRELVPLYEQLYLLDVWDEVYEPCDEGQTYRFVERMAAAMGGTVREAFELMDSSGLYHISYEENKYDSSFEVFLPDYMVPFVFVNPTKTGQDKLTFAHEFGHFCSDYASAGIERNIDVAEFFSQGMEYLSLFYVDGTEDLKALKLADSLCVYVEQAALADFENRVYRMDTDALTVESVQELYGQIADEYGFGDAADSRSYVNIPHLFTSPMYVISYVVSNDAAMQLYQMESEKAGSGLDCYRGQLAVQHNDFLTFVKWAQLTSPFEPGHVKEMKSVFEELFQ